MTRLPAVIERDFQDQVIALAQYNGWKVAHFRPARVLDKDGKEAWRTPVQGDGAGFPDLILARGDRLIAVELKADTGKVSTAQAEWLGAFAATGAETHCWRPQYWTEIERALKRGKSA